MRAIRVHQTGGPDVLQLEEIDLPQPGPGEVRVMILSLIHISEPTRPY